MINQIFLLFGLPYILFGQAKSGQGQCIQGKGELHTRDRQEAWNQLSFLFPGFQDVLRSNKLRFVPWIFFSNNNFFTCVYFTFQTRPTPNNPSPNHHNLTFDSSNEASWCDVYDTQKIALFNVPFLKRISKQRQKVSTRKNYHLRHFFLGKGIHQCF